MMKRTLMTAAVFAASAQAVFAQAGAPLVEVVTEPVRECSAGWNEAMPLIAWGADGAVAYANGGALDNQGGPLLARHAGDVGVCGAVDRI